MKINNKFTLGQIVYLVHDPECYSRMLISLTVDVTGNIIYHLVCGTEYSDHYEDEIVPDRPIL